MWSKGSLAGFMAITAHYLLEIDKTWQMRSRIVGFRHVPGSHAGECMAKHFETIVKDLGIMHKVCKPRQWFATYSQEQTYTVTADNASNNDTMMEELEKRYRKAGIPFHRDRNRIRCVLDTQMCASFSPLLDACHIVSTSS